VTPADRAADKRLQRTYGITLDQYDLMLAAQGGRCAICPRPAESMNTRLHVDHDHKTGLIRGLLCWWCNRKTLPGVKDDPERAGAAADYLLDPPAERVIGLVVAPAKPKRKRKRRKS
jgi:hypothetical protein